MGGDGANMTYNTALNRRISEIVRDNQLAGDHANPAHFSYRTRTPMHKGIIPGNAPYDEMQVFGGKVNRLKKAKRWLGFAKSLVPKSISDALEDKAVGMIGRVGGKVNRLKKAKRWLGFTKSLVPKSISDALEHQAVGMIGKMGGRRIGSTNSRVGGKRVSAWIQHVKAYQQAHGCSYKDAMMGAKATYKK
jgi:hypothetical protein